MALPLLKMDKNEEGLKCAETETDIGLLIGHKLSTFEDMRSPEVNDFRWSVKVGWSYLRPTFQVFASDIARERQARLGQSWR